MINYRVKTTNYVEYGDLEKLIEDTFGLEEFSIPCSEECGNDSNITGTANPDDLREYNYKNITEKKVMYMTRTYINALARKGLFPLGSYNINVSW